MEITEEQRRRLEENRLAALEKRKRAEERSAEDPWRLFRCRKVPSPTLSPPSSCDGPEPENKTSVSLRRPAPPKLPERFRVVLEICSHDEFSVLPQPLPGFAFPGYVECFRIMEAAISSALEFRVSESQGSQFRTSALVYKLKDYDSVLKCIKKSLVVELQEIPYTTLLAIQTFQNYAATGLIPSWKQQYSKEQVDDLLTKLPRSLRDALLPFQMEGVRFGLQRGGRCLIADEMGLGKTIQAIAIACCFMDEGPVLIVCPAILRFSWAEELEHWLPYLLPKDIHLVFGRQNNLDYLGRSPKIVVISFTMLCRLRKSMMVREWSLMIVDESHNIRCTKKRMEPEETKTVLDMATKINRIILLSGTPSLTRPFDIYHQVNILWPGLLGNDKYEFAKRYCMAKLAKGFQGKLYQDFSKGIRLEELNILLRQYVMIRRLKDHVLAQLPPKRRQIITLKLKTSDISLATSLCKVNCGFVGFDDPSNQLVIACNDNENDSGENLRNFDTCIDSDYRRTSKLLSLQEIGIAKLSGFCEWFSNHVVVGDMDVASNLGIGLVSLKMIIFAHHLKVLDGVQDFVCEKGIRFVRIDGRTLPKDRQIAVESFRLSSEVKIAIIGITAGGVGLDFSSAQNVVFLELPKSASEMLQAEDRAHRRGQTNAVNIYIFCAKGTSDESHWLHLNKSLFRVSSMMNGKYDSVKEIEVEGVIQLGNAASTDEANCGNTFITQHQVVSSGIQVSTPDACNSFAVEKSQGSEDDILQTHHHELELNGGRYSILNENLEGNDAEASHSYPSEMRCVLDRGKMVADSVEEEGRWLRLTSADGGPYVMDVGGEIVMQRESLRFEVSHYTGRIHLYLCVPGKDLRPRPIFVNFRQEELDSIVFSLGESKKEAASQLLKENPAYCNIFQTFIKEWSNLRPIERHKLLGKPLQLPLSLELCYLKETSNHGSNGLLKGGSKRRVTPLSEISCHLPENACWKKVVLYSGSAKEKEYTQAWSSNGEPLCKFCHSICNEKLSTAPEFFEDLFCNMSCFQEYRVRTSQKALREALFQIEHGVCTICNLDCHNLVKNIRPLSIARRRNHVENVAPELAKKKKLLDKLVTEPVEGNAWHADHIVPVFKGGGECRLENMRTLCVSCHAEVTKAQRTERHQARKRAKEQLKIAMKGQETELNHCVGGAGGADSEEDPLLVHVPGSAYSES
ncbi:DNA annealing helicase and endonuclease ZRANB3 isoform X2 [Phalaenopsis equestris]|uniref:DNA annealing helicase and endonuclease ZRANB3 isoform X2 n=1 Tax=Phalaenopsis equestris TaxID=78828 RepID=UPI0009E25BF6|nr:DNA annealing helicase and endonuclease ZRANB3 isoform X2 [Phalaenopsis equestris]